MYQRVLLKLSGEQLAGKFDGGIDTGFCKWLVDEVGPIKEQIVIMVGGGNFARGAQLAGGGVKRVTADHIGMLGTLMNALALADIFNNNGLKARALSHIKADQVVDQFTHRRAVSDLNKGRVVISAGGIGRPYLTTDTAAVSMALELDCDVVLKATKVDGIYDKDPEINSDAKKLEAVDYQQAVADGAIRIMDKAALGLAMEHKMPIVVFNAFEPGNIAAAASGQSIGTKIG
ncbi:MAG: UMP kinase [Candidatus Saccharimonadales bacterium]